MKKLAVLFVCAAIVFNFGKIHSFFFPPKSSYLAKQGEIVLYSASWCGYCNAARALLQRENVKFTEFDIEKSKEGAELYRGLRVRGVPVLEIGNEVIRGYSEQRILAALKNKS
jgi:mycoredoxin